MMKLSLASSRKGSKLGFTCVLLLVAVSNFKFASADECTPEGNRCFSFSSPCCEGTSCTMMKCTAGGSGTVIGSGSGTGTGGVGSGSGLIPGNLPGGGGGMIPLIPGIPGIPGGGSPLVPGSGPDMGSSFDPPLLATPAPTDFVVPEFLKTVNDVSSPYCGRVLYPESLYWCPVARYCVLESYSADIRNHLVSNLAYTQFEWNMLLSSTTDELSFSDHTFTARQGLKGLGYTEDKHDCCNSHYGDYAWNDFIDYGYNETLAALVTLGYNQTSWDDDTGNENDDFWWNELSDENQAAAYDGLCYNMQLWNSFPLAMWGDDVEDLPGSYDAEDFEDETAFENLMGDDTDYDYWH